eukprot:7700355-Heterocapsa_arctica.AAC.1
MKTTAMTSSQGQGFRNLLGARKVQAACARQAVGRCRRSAGHLSWMADMTAPLVALGMPQS